MTVAIKFEDLTLADRIEVENNVLFKKIPPVLHGMLWDEIGYAGAKYNASKWSERIILPDVTVLDDPPPAVRLNTFDLDDALTWIKTHHGSVWGAIHGALVGYPQYLRVNERQHPVVKEIIRLNLRYQDITVITLW